MFLMIQKQQGVLSMPKRLHKRSHRRLPPPPRGGDAPCRSLGRRSPWTCLVGDKVSALSTTFMEQYSTYLMVMITFSSIRLDRTV